MVSMGGQAPPQSHAAAYRISGTNGLDPQSVTVNLSTGPGSDAVPERIGGCPVCTFGPGRWASAWSLLTGACLVVANALFIVAFATSGWALKYEQEWPDNAVNYGLWGTCTIYLCNGIPPEDLQEYYHISRGFAVVCIVFQFASFAASGLYIFVKPLKQRSIIATVIVFSFIAALTACACVTVFASGWVAYWNQKLYYEYYFSYSFGLALGAAFLDFCAGAFAIVDLCGHQHRKKMGRGVA